MKVPLEEFKVRRYMREQVERLISVPKVIEEHFYNTEIQELSKHIKSVCMLGVTGNGKSTLTNHVVGGPNGPEIY